MCVSPAVLAHTQLHTGMGRMCAHTQTYESMPPTPCHRSIHVSAGMLGVSGRDSPLSTPTRETVLPT